jgi:hypothetical protein
MFCSRLRCCCAPKPTTLVDKPVVRVMLLSAHRAKAEARKRRFEAKKKAIQVARAQEERQKQQLLAKSAVSLQVAASEEESKKENVLWTDYSAKPGLSRAADPAAAAQGGKVVL